MFTQKKTVANIQATFTTMISDLEAIVQREEESIDNLTQQIEAARTESDAAQSFKQGLGKLLAGQ